MDSALNNLVFRDTPFAELMQKRIYNVLLIATKYDAFMLEDDGRVDEQIFNEYTALNLRYPPRFTRVSDEEEALQALADRNFELVVVMPNMAGKDIFSAANSIKSQYPQIPIVVLTPFSKEVTRRMAGADLSNIDYMFSWEIPTYFWPLLKLLRINSMHRMICNRLVFKQFYWSRIQSVFIHLRSLVYIR